MMKKKTVRLISCIVAGILVIAMLASMLASGLVYAAAAEDDADEASLKDQLSQLEEQKSAVQERIADLTAQANDVQATREALQQEIDLTKQEISTVEQYIERLQQQIDVKTTELEAAEKALAEKEEQFAQTVRTTYEQGDVSYLEVVLNASSFSDLLTRMEIVSAIMEDNQKTVDEYTAAKEDICLLYTSPSPRDTR